MKRLSTWLRGRATAGQDLPPPAPPFGQTPWHPTHRHKKGGGYRFLGYGVQEADRSRVAIYDDAEGTVWVRDAAEFEDGRFTPIILVDPDHKT